MPGDILGYSSFNALILPYSLSPLHFFKPTPPGYLIISSIPRHQSLIHRFSSHACCTLTAHLSFTVSSLLASCPLLPCRQPLDRHFSTLVRCSLAACHSSTAPSLLPSRSLLCCHLVIVCRFFSLIRSSLATHLSSSVPSPLALVHWSLPTHPSSIAFCMSLPHLLFDLSPSASYLSFLPSTLCSRSLTHWHLLSHCLVVLFLSVAALSISKFGIALLSEATPNCRLAPFSIFIALWASSLLPSFSLLPVSIVLASSSHSSVSCLLPLCLKKEGCRLHKSSSSPFNMTPICFLAFCLLSGIVPSY
nr:PREDICTED: uncharacterized protein LOC103277608 [Anolis carolinensis]|eukprot:XP_008101176.1 PREDICTED: uncharacterized protein LOC103277608 [Anolis carolinensis]